MAEIDIMLWKCNQPGCKVAVDGKCLEGFPLTDCTHVEKTINGQPQQVKKQNEVKEEIQSAVSEFESVHLAEPLDEESCRKILSGSITRVVILAGQVNCGKTTFLSSLFELFLLGEFAGYRFSGSDTLIGFERRCHYARIASEGETENTERTKQGKAEFLHLKVQDLMDFGNTDIVFTDISGENFERLSNSTEECKKFTIAKRADHFILFLDSDLLSEKAKRHMAKINGLSILSGLIDSGMLTRDVHIGVVFSRWDKLMEKPDREKNISFIETIKNDVLEKFLPTHSNINFYQVASRPETPSELPFGYGIQEIFPRLVKNSKYQIDDYKSEPKTFQNAKREFSRFLA